MDLKKVMQSAVVFWAVFFLITTLVDQFSAQFWSKQTIVWLVVIFLSYFLADRLHPRDMYESMSVGAMFLVVVVVLDLVIRSLVSGVVQLFLGWQTWVTYFLILLVPTLASSKSRKK